MIRYNDIQISFVATVYDNPCVAYVGLVRSYSYLHNLISSSHICIRAAIRPIVAVSFGTTSERIIRHKTMVQFLFGKCSNLLRSYCSHCSTHSQTERQDWYCPSVPGYLALGSTGTSYFVHPQHDGNTLFWLLKGKASFQFRSKFVYVQIFCRWSTRWSRQLSYLVPISCRR